jgi:hypothetical protein
MNIQNHFFPKMAQIATDGNLPIGANCYIWMGLLNMARNLLNKGFKKLPCIFAQRFLTGHPNCE